MHPQFSMLIYRRMRSHAAFFFIFSNKNTNPKEKSAQKAQFPHRKNQQAPQTRLIYRNFIEYYYFERWTFSDLKPFLTAPTN
jgi:hypothetical protein